MKILFVLLALLLSGAVFCQPYVLPNEEVVFAFETAKGRKAYLVKDKKDAYIQYRFGTAAKVELEYPARNKDSWKRFTYSYYFRGGGRANAGMELDYVRFDNAGVTYVLYYTYYSEADEIRVGIKVTAGGKETDIRGRFRSSKGSLASFRYNGLLEIGEDLYE